jgi:hypothetical protein
MSEGGMPRPLLVTAHAAAAVGAGIFVGWGLDLRPVFGMTQFEPVLLVPSVIAVVAALVALAPRVIRLTPGWTVAALGGVLAVAVQQVRDTPRLGGLTGWLFLATLAVGLVLGGALLALGAETGTARLVIAAGLAAGVLVRPTVFYILLRNFPVVGPGANPEMLLAYGAATVLVAAAVMHGVALQMGAAKPTGTAPPPRGPLVTAGVIAAVAVGAVVANSAISGVIDRSPTFAKLDLPIGQTTAVVNLAASMMMAAAIGLPLAWLAYRRGGLDAARWVVAGCAVALPLAYFPDSFRTEPTLVVAATIVGVSAGAAGAWLADRAAPWDLLGALVCAVALLLTNPRLADSVLPPWAGYTLLIIGVGLVLGAGLTRLARRTDGGDGPGFVERAAPGFAAIILVGQVLVPLAVRSYGSGALAYGLPLTILVFGLALLVLFALGRRRG